MIKLYCENCQKEVEFNGINSVKDIFIKFEGVRDHFLFTIDRELRHLFTQTLDSLKSARSKNTNSDIVLTSLDFCIKTIQELWNGKSK